MLRKFTIPLRFRALALLLPLGPVVLLPALPLIVLPLIALPLTAQQVAPSDTSTLTFRTSVRRVVLDVVVTDADGNPVSGLSKTDFSIAEDGKPQQVLSFEPNGFSDAMDYTPGKPPLLPVNTFVNLPTTSEKGPLYVLLYDLVNMDKAATASHLESENQIRGRQQLAKFIQNKPEGSRFAIFVWSDGLHLIQGFTSDKSQLYAAIDPHSSRPHIPQVFLMSDNFGHGDTHSSIDVLNYIADYLDGMSGRKNLIWFSGEFPLALHPSRNDGPNYTERVKATLNLLAQDQIAIYPVNVRGVVAPELGNNNLDSDSRGSNLDSNGAPSQNAAAGGQGSSSPNQDQHESHSVLGGSYGDMEEIARETGGRAFYSNNLVDQELAAATGNGSHYYTLTYSPTDRNYNGNLRSIHVQLARKGCQLAYRRSYYASDTGEAAALAQGKPVPPANSQPDPQQPDPQQKDQQRKSDTLFVAMKHGAPVAHQLVFGAHVRTVGSPAKGTPEQMALLSTQPAYASTRRRNAPAKPMTPIPLQKFAVDYTVFTAQLRLQAGGPPMHLQIAVAAFDSDGQMLNAVVNNAPDNEFDPTAAPSPAPSSKTYRVEQQMDVPLAATSIRIAVRDGNTDRVGAMEIKLPLAPEQQTADGGKKVSAANTN